jgi:hypothetical protein
MPSPIFNSSEIPNGSDCPEIPDGSKNRLDRIRRLSNVVQAIENLVVQCEGMPDFEDFNGVICVELVQARKILTREIHG